MKKYTNLIALFATLTAGVQIALAQPMMRSSDGATLVAPGTPPPPGLTAEVPPPGLTAEVQRDVAEAIQEAQKAVADAYKDSQNAYGVFGADGLPGLTGPASGTTLIIPTGPMDAKASVELDEDLKVMARILDKVVSHDEHRGRNAMGIAVQVNLFNSSGPRNLYLEGYGALFMLNVNFPLLPPPADNTEPQPKPDTSSEWEETRRELVNPPGSKFNFPYGDLNYAFQAGGTSEEYDADKVEELKQNLTAALKNAAYIRRLKSDETVTVVVSGRNPAVGAKTLKKPSTANSKSLENHGTKMILRARKSDIEAFQKDKLTAQDFQKKSSILIY